MAARYFVNGGVDNNWGTTGNWSTTSGGAGGSSVPTSADDVFFDANSPNCTVNTTTRAALSLTFTGYTNTITMSVSINCSGNVTLSTGMTIAGTSGLNISANATLTSNGKAWAVLTLNNAVTVTLADAWTVSTLTLANNVNVVLNGFSLSVTGNCSFTGITTATVTGTTQIRLTGTGTLTLPPTGTGGVRVEIVINTAGTITFAAAVHLFSGTLTYTAGTVVTTGSTLQLSQNAGATLNTNGLTWNNVSFGATITHTLTSNLQVAGTLTLGVATTTATVVNGGTIEFSGSSLTSALTTGQITGTTILKVINTCTIGAASLTTGRIALPHVIDAPGKTITLNNTWNTDVSHWSVSNGTVVADNTWSTGGGSSVVGYPLSRLVNLGA